MELRTEIYTGGAKNGDIYWMNFVCIDLPDSQNPRNMN